MSGAGSELSQESCLKRALIVDFLLEAIPNKPLSSFFYLREDKVEQNLGKQREIRLYEVEKIRTYSFVFFPLYEPTGSHLNFWRDSIWRNVLSILCTYNQ